jgi:hypothetical protein
MQPMISNAGPHPHQGQYSSDGSISRNPRAEQGRHGEKAQTVGDNLRWPDRVVVSCEDVEELSGREWQHFLLYSHRRPQRISRDDYVRRAGRPLQYAGCTLKAGNSVSQGMTEGTPRNDAKRATIPIVRRHARKKDQAVGKDRLKPSAGAQFRCESGDR